MEMECGGPGGHKMVAQFCGEWNGVEIMTAINRVHPAVTVTLDAFGSWGCGALRGNHWHQLQWEGM